MKSLDTQDIVEAMEPLVGLEIEPEWLPAVQMHLAIAMRHAKTLFDAQLPEDIEPAAVFES